MGLALLGSAELFFVLFFQKTDPKSLSHFQRAAVIVPTKAVLFPSH